MQVSIFEKGADDDALQLALISFERQVSYEKLASILYDEHKLTLQSVDAIILRPPVDVQISDIQAECGTKLIIERFPHLPVHLLYSFNYKIHISGNLNTGINEESDRLKTMPHAEIIAYLRQKELENFILRSSSIFRAPDNTIYRMPSNEYSHVFVRVGNIQMTRTVLDAIFFWAIPSLQSAGSILTDSWSISSVALNISRLLCRYDKNVDISKFHVNMLTSHFDGKKKLDRETENNLYSLAHENERDILFLMSAIKTLKSLKNIKKVLDNLKIENKLEYLAIYRLVGGNDTKFLCDLSGSFSIQNSLKFDSFVAPPGRETVIEIDEKVFFPVNVQETEILVRQYCTKMNEAFFRRYEGKDVIQIHRNSYYFGKDLFRHHGIYLDVSKMLRCKEFTSKIIEEILKFEKEPGLIIYPPHDAGQEMATTIQSELYKKFTKEIELFVVPDIDFQSRGEDDPLINKLNTLTEDDTILVVDDVSTTGSRLKNYQKKLRYTYKGRIHYFIGVARPEKESLWNRRVRDLQFRPSKAKHQVTTIEKVFLPDWDQKTCPWCKERDIIDKVISKPEHAKYPLTSSLKRRYFKLENAVDGGLLQDVFFSINSTKKPLFQGDSVFSPKKEITEADLVASVAAAIQCIRNDGGKFADDSPLIPFSMEYPHFKIININDYMGKNASYNEALVKAAIIRTAGRNELHAKTEINRNRQTTEIENFFNYLNIERGEICFFIYELFLALRDQKLPRPDSGKKMLKVLEEAYLFK